MLEFPATQVTLAVTSTFVPPAVAMAVKHWFPVAIELSGRLKEVSGPTTMAVTLPKVTVAVVVALAVPEAAVMVLVPAETPVSSPPVVMVATLGVALDQHTVVPVQLVPPVSVSALPLLSVPAAVNCAVSPWPTVGLGGSMVMLETVGFTKKPVQLMVKASVARKAKAPAMRSLCFVDDIVISNPLGAPARRKSRYPECASHELRFFQAGDVYRIAAPANGTRRTCGCFPPRILSPRHGGCKKL